MTLEQMFLLGLVMLSDPSLFIRAGAAHALGRALPRPERRAGAGQLSLVTVEDGTLGLADGDPKRDRREDLA